MATRKRRAKTKAKAADVDALDIPIQADHVDRLVTFGYFGNPEEVETKDVLAKITPTKYVRAVKRFQKFRGLQDDGKVGPITERELYFGPKRCALPDILPMVENANSVCKWSFKDMSWWQGLRLPQLDADAIQAAFTQAYQSWAAICDINPKVATGSSTANIRSQSGTGRQNNLDGRGGTLAWSELPCGSTSRNTVMRQMYDDQENWTFDMLVAVASHEIGHAMGLPHLAAGNLMQPYYDPRIIKPQAGDVKEMVARYGRRTTSPPPVDPNNPCQPFEITVRGVVIPGKAAYLLTPAG